MSFADGASYILEIETSSGSGVFVAAGCQKNTDNPHQRTVIDVSNKCNHPHRTLIAGGVRSNDITASGIYSSEQGQQLLEAAYISGAVTTFKLANPDTNDELEGPYVVSAYSKTGDDEGAVQYSVTLLSAGAPTTETGPS